MLAVALLVVLAQAPAAHDDRRPQTDETVPAQRGQRLSINNFAGEVVVHAWDKDAVHITARHQARTTVLIRPGSAAITLSATGTMGPQGAVDYDISAPAWMAIRVEGTYNFVTVDGARGEVFVNTVRGDVTIKGGTGFVTAKSVEGEVDVDDAHGKLVISSVNEKIRITHSSGEIAVDTVNGGISMTGIDSNSVDATTVNGPIVFEGKIADGGHYSFNSHNGDLLLGLPDVPNASFSVRTYQGSFSSDLPLEGGSRDDMRRGRRVTMTSGSGSADVSLETFGGSIRVRRGPVAPLPSRKSGRHEAGE